MELIRRYILCCFITVACFCVYSEQNETKDSERLTRLEENMKIILSEIRTFSVSIQDLKQETKGLALMVQETKLDSKVRSHQLLQQFRKSFKELRKEVSALSNGTKTLQMETQSIKNEMMSHTTECMKAQNKILEETRIMNSEVSALSNGTKTLQLETQSIKNDMKVDSERITKSIQELRGEMSNHSIECMNVQNKIMEETQSMNSETKSNLNKVLEIIENSDSLLEEMKNETMSNFSEVLGIIQNSNSSIEELKKATEHLKTIVMTDIYQSIVKIQATKQDTKRDFQKVLVAFHKTIMTLEETKEETHSNLSKVLDTATKSDTSLQQLKEETMSNLRKVSNVVQKSISLCEDLKEDTQKQFSRLFFLRQIAKQDLKYSPTYTDEMRKSVHGKYFDIYNLPAILCDLNGVFIVDWNLLNNNNWNVVWRNLLNGHVVALGSVLMLPENGILTYFDLTRKGSNLLVRTVYSRDDKTPNPPSSIDIYFHVKLIIENRNETSSTIITRQYQQSQIQMPWTTIVTISSADWDKFSTSKLPILEFHLVAMKSND